MTSTVALVVLLGALLHASWNAVVKNGDDKLLSMVLVMGVAGTMALAALPFLPLPAKPSWGFIAASSVIQTVYCVMVAAAYRAGDMSQAYPLMRGAAPLLVALASGPLVGEALPPFRWLAIGVICCGVFVLALYGRHAGRKATLFALANAVIIASYTLIDGVGVRRSGVPLAYSLWIFLLTALPLLPVSVLYARSRLVHYCRTHLRNGLIGGVGTLGSYSLSLWAMTRAPVAAVAALRETASLFGLLISTLVLREALTAPRLLSILCIAAGAVLIRLS
jgi:drug/metabolite transporter (DMT)-like permease